MSHSVQFTMLGCKLARDNGVQCHLWYEIDSDMFEGQTFHTLFCPRKVNTLLYNLLVGQGLPVSSVSLLGTTACGALVFPGLNYIHSAGIYHRDLKPANCFVNQDGPVSFQHIASSLGNTSRIAPSRSETSVCPALSKATCLAGWGMAANVLMASGEQKHLKHLPHTPRDGDQAVQPSAALELLAVFIDSLASRLVKTSEGPLASSSAHEESREELDGAEILQQKTFQHFDHIVEVSCMLRVLLGMW